MQREFQIGSNWIYYKIYCGAKIADTLLIEYFNDTIYDLKQNKIIEKWFFIRYNDPDSHIRLRFLVCDNFAFSQVVSAFTNVFETLKAQNLIWNVQMDTYVRELERYGALTYEITESIFEKDSEMILAYLQIKNTLSDNIFQLLFSFLSIDNFLQQFELNISEKAKLLNQMQLSFKSEFKANSVLKSELDKHYRSISKEILNQENLETLKLLEIVNSKNEKIKPLIFELKSNWNTTNFSYLTSQIHMMINRQFTSQQRAYELIIYDHLHRYYKSKEFNS